MDTLDEFRQYAVWPGDRPHFSGGGGASTSIAAPEDHEGRLIPIFI